MSQHTRGPWEISKHGTPAYAPQYGVYAEGRQTDHVIVTGDHAEADARLIAAAPDLLAACRNLADAFELLLADDTDNPRYVAARAAIAKAVQP